ncbi:hypothetical protein [Brevibacterium sp. XM4083]|uniref:hypothetical protein n=1 Tax=Brevibacterium sp. XM4083 TaxID=2583238 RepID=UPI0011279C46|nr:hypothetical protein [Brevibacterium sp. XM4083]MCM1011934.1 hypothetical protein [Brevibacterium sp. XM4083]
MSEARIVFGNDVIYNAQPEIVRAMQAVMSALHRDGIGYQVRLGMWEGETTRDGYSTIVVLVGPCNPPRFEYTDRHLPDLAEEFEDLLWKFSAKALHERVVDLMSLRDAFESVLASEPSE